MPIGANRGIGVNRSGGQFHGNYNTNIKGIGGAGVNMVRNPANRYSQTARITTNAGNNAINPLYPANYNAKNPLKTGAYLNDKNYVKHPDKLNDYYYPSQKLNKIDNYPYRYNRYNKYNYYNNNMSSYPWYSYSWLPWNYGYWWNYPPNYVNYNLPYNNTDEELTEIELNKLKLENQKNMNIEQTKQIEQINMMNYLFFIALIILVMFIILMK